MNLPPSTTPQSRSAQQSEAKENPLTIPAMVAKTFTQVVGFGPWTFGARSGGI
jgi:hypothetical protein